MSYLDTIEEIGFVTSKGNRIYGSAAVTAFLYKLHNTKISDITDNDVKVGKRILQKYLDMKVS